MKKRTGERRKLSEKIKSVDRKHYAAIVLLLCSAALLFFRFETSLNRLISSCTDLVTSVVYWAWSLVDFDRPFDPTVTDLSRIDLSALPYDLKAIEQKILTFGTSWYDLDLFFAYNDKIGSGLYNTLLVLAFLILPLVLLGFIFVWVVFSKNKRPVGHRSKPLRLVLFLEKKCVFPVISRIRDFLLFFFERKTYKRWFVFLWLLNTNVISVGIGAIAYYYYFLAVKGFEGFFTQILKLFIDVLITWFSLPALVWLGLIYFAFDRYRREKGYQELEHREAKNCGFLKSTGMISNTVGPPGVGKTTFIVSAAQSWVNIFREDSKELLLTDMMTFAEFPFLAFERELRERIADCRIYNVPSAEMYAAEVWNTFSDARKSEDLYGYDFKRFGLEKDVGNRIETLENTLREHAKAYFIYLCENPSLSNFPIRFDGKFDSSEIFPLWKNNFFRSKPQDIAVRSVYSHILDQDLMRLGKTVQKGNSRAGTFGFGIYTNTEWGKSRGNTLMMQGVDKNDEKTNQKNDLYTYAHKMCRHASTMVRGKVFFRFLGDEQRPKTLDIDLRDLCSILTVMSKSEEYLVMPYFIFGDMLYSWLYRPLLKVYQKYINLRGDETLFSYFLLRKPLSLLSDWYRRIYNIFGCFDLEIKKEAGTSYGDKPDDAAAEYCTYYIMPKKDYADRYNSDCYEGFFSKRQLDSGVGINQYPCYTGKDMTIEQMEEQKDYFLLELMKVFAGEHEIQKAETKPTEEASSAETKEVPQEDASEDDFIFMEL